jgi:ribosomal protein S18 acetylase RimI-like enzyme
MPPEISQACTDDDFRIARTLLLEYAESLGFSLAYQGFDRELEEIENRYAPPSGALLLARVGADVAGIVALRRMTAEIGEMKRLYVRPAFRGRRGEGPSIGRALADAIVESARVLGYRRVRLDTVASRMEPAMRLYDAIGFVRIAPYYDSPIADTVFLELLLY